MLARKIPSATRRSPASSGCWWPLPPRRRFLRFTRAGIRGLSVRFLRRRAMCGVFVPAPALPASSRGPACEHARMPARTALAAALALVALVLPPDARPRSLVVAVGGQGEFRAAVSALRDSGGTIVLRPGDYSSLVVPP